MRVQVLYFAVFRERIGRASQDLELPERSDVAAAVSKLEEQHEDIARLRGRYRVALNQEMLGDWNVALCDGDEIALIPPVAGGIDQRYAKVLDEVLSLERVIEVVRSDDRGAVATFTGVVRNYSEGRSVVRLEYEAYIEMAEKTLMAICQEIEAAVPNVRVAVEHRVGALQVGDAAVVIAAASPHRKEAFAACQRCIEELKRRAPIWKREVGPDGAEWVGLGP